MSEGLDFNQRIGEGYAKKVSAELEKAIAAKEGPMTEQDAGTQSTWVAGAINEKGQQLVYPLGHVKRVNRRKGAQP